MFEKIKRLSIKTLFKSEKMHKFEKEKFVYFEKGITFAPSFGAGLSGRGD